MTAEKRLPPPSNSDETSVVRSVAEWTAATPEEAVLAAIESEATESNGEHAVNGAPDPRLSPGSLLDGRYIVGDVLAEGGMGVVYLGRHAELGQQVAIKLLRPDVADRPSVVQRFLNEGRAAASLKSEHVVRVMDVGQLDTGHPYLVMEHLDGTDLEALLENSGRFDIDQALDYALQICSALAEAHANGIVHRDIKPENLFLVEGVGRSLVKVLDFGLAKRIDSTRSLGLTGPEDSMGSPYYMSPEQIMTPLEVDARTDIWSLGVVLYRFLTGRLPFQGDTILEVYAHVINATPQSMNGLRPEVDSELEGIVRRCLEKSASKRYESIDELSQDLSRYRLAQRGPARVTAPPVIVDETPIVLPGVHSRMPAVLAFALVLLGTAGFYAARTGRFDARAVSERVSGAVFAGGQNLGITDGWLAAPRLSEALEPPMPRSSFAPTLLGPSLGVFTREPVVDARGVLSVRAEPEPESSAEDEGSAEAASDAREQRDAEYRRYLDQNGLVPLKEALEKLKGEEHAP